MFLYSFICAPTTAFTWLSKVWISQLSSVFLPILGPLLVQGFILERGPKIFKLFKNTICKGVCTYSALKNLSSLLPPSIFFLYLSPIKNLKEALNMSTYAETYSLFPLSPSPPLWSQAWTQPSFKGSVSRDCLFFEGLNMLTSTFCDHSKAFHGPYKIINFLIASLKLLTNSENAHWNPPQSSLLCDWSKYANVDPSLVAAGKGAKFTSHRQLSIWFNRIKDGVLNAGSKSPL